MVETDNPNEPDLAAGDFSTWLGEIAVAIRGEQGMDVPCGGCTACCTSSQFVPIGPDETDTLAHIPAELVFPAPGWPPGSVVLGYDERGHCPMLVENQCSIYEHRPTTCRTYDCRVFPAAGLELAEAGKDLIAQRARQWRFDFPTADDIRQQEAVRTAAAYFAEHADLLPDGVPPANATQLAVLAIEVHALFLRTDPTPEEVRVELLRTKEARHERAHREPDRG